MEKLHLEKCYICLPIAGQEDTVFERSENAKRLVKELGFEPICPLEINEQNKENIDTHDNFVPNFMGNDIKILIGECSAIFVCKGWENSKGCNVELECAKQYGIRIFWESIPLKKFTLQEGINYKWDEFYQKYRFANEKYGPASLEVSRLKRQMENYRKCIDEYFDID